MMTPLLAKKKGDHKASRERMYTGPLMQSNPSGRRMSTNTGGSVGSASKKATNCNQIAPEASLRISHGKELGIEPLSGGPLPYEGLQSMHAQVTQKKQPLKTKKCKRACPKRHSQGHGHGRVEKWEVGMGPAVEKGVAENTPHILWGVHMLIKSGQGSICGGTLTQVQANHGKKLSCCFPASRIRSGGFLGGQHVLPSFGICGMAETNNFSATAS
ncbi:hypothetical protein Ancab_019590 [Ancistrocladus abbreviatus]